MAGVTLAMCGLAGLVHLKGLALPGLSTRLLRATERLYRRGPDDQRTWQDNQCALAFARLAVIDLTPEAAQPMARHDRIVVFNGEIYNYQSLRRELEQAGYHFSSQSDTEVVLAGWSAWGPDLLPRLNGMFAFALWDPQEETLILARDRFGKKPMVYAAHSGEIAFASDIVALGMLSDRIGGIDLDALRLFCALRYIPAPWTIRAGVRKLLPGHYLKFSQTGVQIHRWYNYNQKPSGMFLEKIDAREKLRAAFDQACRDRLVADVPVGAFLSSGIDSALVAASLANQNHKVRSFTVGFKGASSYYEERPVAANIANYLGLEHTEIELTEADALRSLPTVFDGLDEPFADSSALPTYLLSEAVRHEVTVALSGDGGDEVFGGYRKYQGELWARTYAALPAFAQKSIKSILSILPQGSKDTKTQDLLRKMQRFAAYATASPIVRQTGWATLLSSSEADILLPQTMNKVNPIDLVEKLHNATKDNDPINAMLSTDIALVLPDDMLTKVDRMSMWASLEVRCPMLDQRVVECAMAMPGSWKLQLGRGKAILREAFADRLPKDIFRRSKRGFEIPLSQWLRKDLSSLMDKACDPVLLRRQGIFDPCLPVQWRNEHRSNKRDRSWELWMLISFQEWAQRNSL
ncbi:MAG: asparagine synthase (glutamine-hydrolyzing) [Alphaproteobacteria bacterium]